MQTPPKQEPQVAKKKTIPPGVSLAAGAVAGAVEATSTVRITLPSLSCCSN
jgi:solute carrier family 25 citrate transporter 1